MLNTNKNIQNVTFNMLYLNSLIKAMAPPFVDKNKLKTALRDANASPLALALFLYTVNELVLLLMSEERSSQSQKSLRLVCLDWQTDSFS